MTKVELALILKTIDAHTTVRTYNYPRPTDKIIEDVAALKQDIIQQYEYITGEE